MGQDYRVALIAIASNEGAYLAQFVFHHLRMGFGPIILITNNSEDDTAAMAARMAERLPEVYHLDGDPLRVGEQGSKNFQNRAYQTAFAWLGHRSIKPDYIMLIDVDEFWVPLNGATDVSHYIRCCSEPDAMLFNWVAPFDDTIPFAQPFNSSFKSVPQANIKSFWRYGIKITGLNAHIVYSPDIKTDHVASGSELFETRYKTIVAPVHPGDAMVVHQMYRSMVEYVAILLRGRPSLNATFKDNRWGYRHNLNERSVVVILLPESHGASWQAEFPAWVEVLGLTEMLVQSRVKVLERATRALALYESLSEEERAPYANAFRFVDFDAVRAEIAGLLADPKGRIAQIP